MRDGRAAAVRDDPAGRMIARSFRPLERKLEVLLGLWLVLLVAAFVVVSRQWPLVGDVSYLHYVVFLMRHGMVPYRDIVDMNLPGAYMLESAVMQMFGPGSPGWRIYDFALLAIGAVSMVAILRRQGWLAGVFAAAMFVLVHGQDGEIMSGERDFAVAVFLLAAVALLFVAWRRERAPLWAMGAAGVLAGFAVTIKPTALPLVAALTLATLWRDRRAEKVWPVAFVLVAGLAVPVAATLVFLMEHGAVAAFVEALHGLIPYHASLAHRSFSFLLGHSVSPLLPLFALWVIVAAQPGLRGKPEYERAVLLICAAGGLAHYLLQQKGFAYQRYPFTAFLLVLIAGDFATAGRLRSHWQWLGVAGMLGGAALCTSFLLRTMKFDHGEPPRPLLADLRALDVAQGQVQCMDTAGSCIDALNAGGILQATGFLYDCYLLDGANATAVALRSRFWDQMAHHPPGWIVSTDSVCYEPVRSFDNTGVGRSFRAIWRQTMSW